MMQKMSVGLQYCI